MYIYIYFTKKIIGTGPDVDHTTGTINGKYIYIEASSPAKPGYKARIKSPIFKSNDYSCFELWYHMKGMLNI